MGCITTVGKTILIILNVVFLIVSLVLIAAGILLKFFASLIATLLLGTVGSLDSSTQSDFNIAGVEDIEELPFIGDVGLALIVFGAFLFVISFLACCGACCKSRIMLIVFVILMSILVISQAVVGGLFLSKGSILHSTIEDTLGDKVKTDFKEDGKDAFSVSINLLNYQLRCCGIRDYKDFKDEKRPASCCKKDIIDGNDSLKKQQCTSDPPGPQAEFNEQGCYPKILDLALGNIVIAGVVLGLLLLLQVLEIVFAILVVLEESNKIKMRLAGASVTLTGLIVLGACLTVSARLAVMSIDLGGEFMKIAIVKPGVPMEIVLNKESARKTKTIVAFRDGERHFANDAYNTAVRFPDKAFWFLTHVIGRHYDDPLVQQYRQRFPFYDKIMVKDDERGTVLFKDPDNDDTLYSAEELMGMILEKAREYAQDFAEQEIKDAVITVPPYYTQAERRAVRTAAELVGINVLQLMSDSAAVALNYGVFRRKNFNTTAQYYMFYDMGATSTVATVVSYQLVKVKEGTRVETNPQLTIKGIGYDRNLGGLEMTLRLRDHLAKVFNSQKKRSIKVEDNPRAMAKLLKEAERVKKVLSANADHMAQVEGLLEGEDFRAKVTRDEFETMCKDLLQRVTRPLEEALKSSEITLGEISEVILMGGSSRVPKVQELLMKSIGRDELGKSINTDEAAALGAVYQAAYLGKGFKVKTFHVRDGNVFPINVEFEKQKSGDDGATAARVIKRTLFGRMNPFPQKKVMTFNKHFTDFSFAVRYGDLDFLPEEERKTFETMSLTNVSLVGVAEALAKHKDGADYKGVKAHFRMDESGILTLDKVESVFEKQQPAEAEKPDDESTWS
ncbi:hypothetical protein BaRGS_00038437, partial [Batillaria attramentaria]